MVAMATALDYKCHFLVLFTSNYLWGENNFVPLRVFKLHREVVCLFVCLFVCFLQNRVGRTNNYGFMVILATKNNIFLLVRSFLQTVRYFIPI